jgi:hypothetical protein
VFERKERKKERKKGRFLVCLVSFATTMGAMKMCQKQ